MPTPTRHLDRLVLGAALAALTACTRPGNGNADSDGTTDTTADTSATATTTDITDTGDPPRMDLATPDFSGDLDCLPEELATVCPWQSQSTLIAGDTPNGPVSFERAYFGGTYCGLCLGRRLSGFHLVTQAAAPPEPDTPWLPEPVIEISFDLDADLRAENASLRLWTQSPWLHTTATIELDALPTPDQWKDPVPNGKPIELTGTIVADQDGFALSGSFAATFCGYVSEGIPCE